MTVPRGASRSNRRAHPSRLSWVRGFLPSWSCEFDSRHPLHIIAPSQRTFSAPKLFEHSDDKKYQAGQACLMIIGARCTEVPCQARLQGRESGSAEVDQAGCVPFMSFGCENRRASTVPAGIGRHRLQAINGFVDVAASPYKPSPTSTSSTRAAISTGIPAVSAASSTHRDETVRRAGHTPR
jgi:hypothetical protein